MLIIGIDRKENKVYIDDAVSRGDYFCPTCGKPLVVKKGFVNAPHFAHWPKHPCTDSWNNTNDINNSYDVSEWHNSWEMNYPEDNREITISFGDIKHRGDIVIDNTVIEFQHSPISSSHFQERTNIYLNSGYKVIWLFDYTDEFSNEKIDFNGLNFEWIRPNSTFRDVTCVKENVDIFFQLTKDENCIIRVDNISNRGFELFKGSQPYSKTGFMEYTGLSDGKCLPPNTKNAEDNNQRFNEFMKKYPITLDKDQQRAVQTVDGANLILSVPGSGKTTVLTYRLGYLAIEKGIKPDNILAITYTNAAEDEMKKRLQEYFHGDIKGNINIRTINSLGKLIVEDKTNGKLKTADPKETRNIVVDCLRMIEESYYIDNIKLYESAISYIKSKINQEAYFDYVVSSKQLSPSFPLFFKRYNAQLNEKNLIDFNDQNSLALEYLKEDPELLRKYQKRFKYICVDEAQDTNQVQYELIKMIAGKKPNLFMVGDEDQSIYGFNGSYPEALLSFRDEYDNPFILKLERNYRSTSEIVDVSRDFIDRNPKRSFKDMYSFRGGDHSINIVELEDTKKQASLVSNALTNRAYGAAILYRENSSAIPVAYWLWKNNVPFYFIKNEVDTFKTSNFVKVFSLLRLTIDPRDFQSFLNIYGSISRNIYPSTAGKICDIVRRNGGDLLSALHDYVENNRFKDKSLVLNRIEYAQYVTEDKAKNINKAIEEVCRCIIPGQAQIEKTKRILISIAEDGETIEEYLQKIEKLMEELQKHTITKEGVALSTFHSAKGLEFDRVYLIDVFDGVCPSTLANDNKTMYYEERRLFYVAMTRAINQLFIVKLKNVECSFINEIERYISDHRSESKDNSEI